MRSAKGGLFRPPEERILNGLVAPDPDCPGPVRDGDARNTSESPKTASSLVFENLTDRARAEESRVIIQTGLPDSLLEQATSQPSYEESGASGVVRTAAAERTEGPIQRTRRFGVGAGRGRSGVSLGDSGGSNA